MIRTTTPPQHGERRCYLRGCRQDECVQANRRYCKQYRLSTVRQPIRIDITPVADRLAHWTNQGYSQTQMAEVSAVSAGDLSKLVNGKQQRIHPDVARRILNAPDPTGTPFHAVTDATGAVRRGRALHRIGYPFYAIAPGVPMNINDLARMLINPPTTVRVSVANGMTSFCRRLRWAPGPSVLARQSAQRRNWYGPFVWDDIDDPAAEPEDEAVAETSAYSKRIDVEHLLRFGVSADEVQARTGASLNYIREIAAEVRNGKPRDRSRTAAAA